MGRGRIVIGSPLQPVQRLHQRLRRGVGIELNDAQQHGKKPHDRALPGRQFRVEHIVRWPHQATDILQGLSQFVMPDRRVDALTQFDLGQIGIEQHPARVGQRRSSLIQILQ